MKSTVKLLLSLVRAVRPALPTENSQLGQCVTWAIGCWGFSLTDFPSLSVVCFVARVACILYLFLLLYGQEGNAYSFHSSAVQTNEAQREMFFFFHVFKFTGLFLMFSSVLLFTSVVLCLGMCAHTDHQFIDMSNENKSKREFWYSHPYFAAAVKLEHCCLPSNFCKAL